MSWIKKCLTDLSKPTATPLETCQVLQTIMVKLKAQPTMAAEVLEYFYHPNKQINLLSRLTTTENEELVLCTVQCFEEAINSLNEGLTPLQLEVLEAMGSTLLHFHYSSNKQFLALTNRTLFLLTTLSLLGKITLLSPHFVQVNISELLGIAKLNVRFGLDSGSVMLPEKVLPTDNLSFDSSTEEMDSVENDTGARRSGGGRVWKKRKPRTLAKSMQNNHQQEQSLHHQTCIQTLTLEQIIKDIRTSDSDASELENNITGTCFPQLSSAQDRQKFSRVRLLAINLLGNLVSRIKDRRIIYGYYDAFFENTKIPSSNERNKSRSYLLYIGMHDPNIRCRATALQVAGQLIFSFKNLLQQAECAFDRLPIAFLPFASRLGLQVVSMFEDLTQILENESSLAVLTQALKCLAVLVQATTPFHKFSPRSFIANFSHPVHRLVLHRDATIQVAALMVLEFLISTPDLTPEIASAIGAVYRNLPSVKEPKIPDERSTEFLEMDNHFEEHIQSESEDESVVTSPKERENISSIEEDTTPQERPCWLLHRVLQNLGALQQYEDRMGSSPSSVRIESLQILAAMAQHFWLLESHLKHVAIALQNTMSETLSDVRICGARCLDTFAYQIGRTLMENKPREGAVNSEKSRKQLEEHCLNFWEEILPTILTQIRSSSTDSSPVVKVCLFDSLSNIGVIIFERQSYATQMKLVGSLSSIACDPNEDVTVRCACVRALAVYALFPSLRDNLVFVENAAELTLRLLGDRNVLVRVKASWSLGNITDALLVNINNTTDADTIPERISEDLLWRLISAATEACNDNDKVRCNVVRVLGNLLRLLDLAHFKSQTNEFSGNRLLFNNAILKLIDCLRASSSAKVKWNTCYSIGNLLQNSALFNQSLNDGDWQSKLFSTLTNIIVNHPNFKVRINAATALTRTTRSQLKQHYEMVWKALLDAIEQSHHLENFYEYNHRDQLQEQLCFALSHMLRCAHSEDFSVLHKHLEDERSEMLRNTWTRVVNRMVPEKSAPILACAAFLHQELKDPNANFTLDQKNAISSIARIVEIQ